MKRVAIYVRVSTDEQKREGLSIDNQIDALKTYADENSLHIVDIYNDAGISARKKYTRRPELLRLMHDCEAGKIDLIIFTRLDRWFRSVGDYYEVQAILDKCNVPWRTIWEDYETETSAGVFKVNIMLSIAQAEADRTSEKIKSVLEYKRQRGEYVGSSSMYLGYRRDGSKIVKAPEEAAAVRAVFDTFLATASISAARQAAYDCGVDLKINRCRRMVVAPIYAGKIQNVSVEPYITQEEHEQCVRICEGMRTRINHINKRSHVFSGLCVCSECGNKLLVRQSKPRGDKMYCYYVCRTSKGHRCNVSEVMLERYLLDNYMSLLDAYEAKTALSNKERKGKEGQLKKLNAKLSRLAILFEEGDIDTDEYKTKRDNVKREIQALEQELKPNRSVELPANWREIYNELDNDHKRAFWAKAFHHIEAFDDGKRYKIVF